jgi:hypothetical protein
VHSRRWPASRLDQVTSPTKWLTAQHGLAISARTIHFTAVATCPPCDGQNLLALAVSADGAQVQLGATNSGLDRAGISKPTEVVLSQREAKPYEEIFDGIAGISREESRARRDLPPDNPLVAGSSPARPTVTAPPLTASLVAAGRGDID